MHTFPWEKFMVVSMKTRMLNSEPEPLLFIVSSYFLIIDLRLGEGPSHTLPLSMYPIQSQEGVLLRLTPK